MLFNKMIRDIWQSRGTYIACIVIMAIGLMTYNVFSIAYSNIERSVSEFYEGHRFGDGFVEVLSMPTSALSELRKIPEIKQVDGRLVKDVKIIDENREAIGYLRLTSFREDESDALNTFEVLEGAPPVNNANAVLLGKKYFDATKQEIGNTISILTNGKLLDLTVSGSMRSPEYVYALRTDKELYPEPTKFGIAYMPYEEMKALFQSGQTVNNIAFTMKKGADFRDIEIDIESHLKKYGILKLYERKNHVSHLMLKSEMDGLREISKSLPVVFLGIAGAILIIMLKRLIEKQRGQVGVLKAFGYKDKEILLHYMSYAVVIGIFGGVIGGVLGNSMVGPLVAVYQNVFNMPLVAGGFSLLHFVNGMLMSLVASLIAGFLGSMSSLALEPAEAMRPPAPIGMSGTLLERWTYIWSRLTMINRIAIRNIFRNKGRSVFLLVGVIFTVSILGIPYALNENMNTMIFDQFKKVTLYDAKVILNDPMETENVMREVERQVGIEREEALMEVPVELSRNGNKKLVTLIGLEKDSQLYKLRDMQGNAVEVPDKGLLLSERLSILLDAQVGSTVQLKSPYSNAKNNKSHVIVSGIIPQYLGLNAYMADETLLETLNQSSFTTSAILKISDEGATALRSEYKDSSTISTIEMKDESIEKYESMMQMMVSVLVILIIVGMISGFAIIYASSMITLSERQRELASMLVIGMSYKEVRQVMYLEQWYIAGVGVVMSLPILKFMIVGLSSALENDVYSIPTTMSIGSVISAAILAGLSIVIAQQSMKIQLNKIQLVEALSMRE